MAGVNVGTDRLVKKVEALFNLLPAAIAEFDHFTPMDWLFRNPAVLDGDDEGAVETRARAKRIIAVLNELLPRPGE